MNHPRKVHLSEARPDDTLRRRVRAEYREMPGLKLTPAQAARLWHLGLSETAQLLESMADAGLLYRSRDGAYLLLWSRSAAQDDCDRRMDPEFP